jgi:hypothetical protein
LDFLTLEDGTNMLSWKSVKDYHSTVRNIPEVRRSHTRIISEVFCIAVMALNDRSK